MSSETSCPLIKATQEMLEESCKEEDWRNVVFFVPRCGGDDPQLKSELGGGEKERDGFHPQPRLLLLQPTERHVDSD